MKNNAGKIIGFTTGTMGFLILFKILVINNTTPEDELAPGMVLLLALLNGMIFAFLGNLIQSRLKKNQG